MPNSQHRLRIITEMLTVKLAESLAEVEASSAIAPASMESSPLFRRSMTASACLTAIVTMIADAVAAENIKIEPRR